MKFREKCSISNMLQVRSVSGSSSRCEDGGCGTSFYPTTTPVGIVAVVDAEADKMLLVRQPRFPPGMFSCVAGFLDVGETLEDCVRREVAEEVGLEVENVSYRSSQHWPFPSGSLMIGCHALVKPGQTVQIDKKEIDEARWFSRKEVASALKVSMEDPLVGVRGKDVENIFVPPSGALAHHLIKDWHLS